MLDITVNLSEHIRDKMLTFACTVNRTETSTTQGLQKFRPLPMSENIFKKWTFLQLLTCKNDPIQSQNLIPSFLVRGLPFRTTWFKLLHRHRIRIRHKIQCWCPRGKSSSSDQFPSPYPWITKSPKKFKDFAFCKQSITYDHVVHKFGYRHRAWGYGEEWLTYYYIAYCYASVSKPSSLQPSVLVLKESPCLKDPWGPIYKSLSLSSDLKSLTTSLVQKLLKV